MRKLLLILSVLVAAIADAETPLNYKGEFVGTAGNSDLAPYYMMSNNGGVVTQGKNVLLRAAAWKDLDLSKRFSYSFGVDAYGGHSNASAYLKYNTDEQKLLPVYHRPSSVVLQQLYGEVKYRGVFLSVGMKERTSPLLNSELGVGDYIQSNNARPIPQVRVGFVDFQDIPFTKGWVQIQGEFSYGKYMDDGWLEDHYNYQNRLISKDILYHYKRCYFRTKPSKPFSVTVGMQVVCQFGGSRYYYSNGKLTKEEPYDFKFKDLIKAFIPQSGGNNANDTEYYFGNMLGAWDLVLRYRFKDKTEIKAYMQSPYEDGSGVGKLNGFDGIWGIDVTTDKMKGYVNNVVLEFIHFTNQSGPLHRPPMDNIDPDRTGEATGGDNYYNHYLYKTYMNYGMSQGTPFIPSVIYKKDGRLEIYDNRIRGFHMGLSGNLCKELNYRMLLSYRKSWGTWSHIRLNPVDDFSFMLEGCYNFKQVKGLSLKGQIAFDRGNLIGDNFGGGLTLSYNGLLNVFGK